MVDAGDLKSPDRKVVRVRLPLAPLPSKGPSRADLSKHLFRNMSNSFYIPEIKISLTLFPDPEAAKEP